MWRMNYTILINLPRLPKILENMHRITNRPDIYSEQDGYDQVRHVVSLMQKTGHIKTEGYGMENLPREGGYSDDKKNTLWDFKPGSFKAATKAGVPIVPVALVNSYKAYNSRQITPVKTP